MIISFDLDDTLFIDPSKYLAEKELKFPYKIIYKERLRLGSIELLSKIKANSIQLWIYTTSFRSEKYIRSLFLKYGIKVDRIINGETHQKEVQCNQNEPMPSKYPSKYRIALNIDDDISVAQNGRRYGFRVFLLEQNNKNWVNDIWDEIEKIKKLPTEL